MVDWPLALRTVSTSHLIAAFADGDGKRSQSFGKESVLGLGHLAISKMNQIEPDNI